MKKAYIFVHIPKTAGSFIKSLKSSKIVTPKLPLPHSTLRILERHFPSIHDQRVGVFSVVRNPYDRIYSLWKHLPKISYSPEVIGDFEIFVKDLCSDYYLGDLMCQSQLHYIRGYENFDFNFFKLEEKDKLKDFLINECGSIWSDEKVNVTPGPHFTTVYTPELIDLVKNKFIEEFETFGYSTNFPLTIK